MFLWEAAKLVFGGLFGGGAGSELVKDAGWMLFAWNVLGKAMGDGFYRFITIAGLLLALAVAVGHFWKGGKLAKFKAYRGIGLLLSILAVFVTVVGLTMAAAETVSDAMQRRQSPAARRAQDIPVKTDIPKSKWVTPVDPPSG